MFEGSYDSYESYDARFDLNRYATVPLQKFVLAEDDVAREDFT